MDKRNLKDGYKIKDLIKIFDLKVINADKADLERETRSPSIHRTGLELAGVNNISHTAKNIISWGTKEQKWFSEIGEKRTEEAVDYVFTEATPLVLLSKKITKETQENIVKVANKYRIPVVATGQHLATLRATIGSELVEHFATKAEQHGSLVIIDGIGIMIIGKSGIGKSEAVLELIQKGHSFITDDTVIINQIGQKFNGTSTPLTKGLLEARGIGIVNVPYIYGHKSVKDSTEIELVVELVQGADAKNIDRLGIQGLSFKILDGEIPLMQIPVTQGRSIASLIEAATNVFSARKSGLDPLEEIASRRQD